MLASDYAARMNFGFRVDPRRPVPLAAISRAVAVGVVVNVVMAGALATRIGLEAIAPAFVGVFVAGVVGVLCLLPASSTGQLKLQLLVLAGLIFEGTRGLREAWASQELARFAWRLHVFVPMSCVVLFLLVRGLQRRLSEQEP